MFKQRPSERRKRIVDQVARMLAEHIHRHNFPDIEAEELFARLGVTRSVADNAWWGDIPELCDRAGLDLGLTVKDSRGSTVTLWPGENFGCENTDNAEAPKRPATPAGQKA